MLLLTVKYIYKYLFVLLLIITQFKCLQIAEITVIPTGTTIQPHSQPHSQVVENVLNL